MIADLNPDQQALADYMSELSEEAWYAGWMQGLEYALWEAVLGLRTDYGRLTMSEEHRTRLKRLSDACSGWIVFDEHTEETWVSLENWMIRFSSWQQLGVSS